MDVPDYKCGVRQEESKKDKLAGAYSIAVDSGYDSIYSGCASVLMEKSFSRESFDIFSPNSPNRTPGKHTTSALKYHISTPKTSASVKRHLYSSFNTSSLKRSKSENIENEPKTVVNSSILYNSDHLNDSACPLKALHNYDFSPRKNILSSTTSHQLSISNASLSDSKHSTSCSWRNNPVPTVPERPSKSLQYFKPLVKHSKRKLDIPTVENKEKTGRIFFNGTLYLNIIGKLVPFPAILDDIFKSLSSKDLLNVSLVSRNWNSIVKSNRNANTRLQHYLNESRNVKENFKDATKPAIIHKERHPFSQFNIVSTSNKSQNSSLSGSFFENQNVVEKLHANERLVKCPRCGRGSIISDSSTRLHSTSIINVPSIASLSSESCSTSLIQNKSDSICSITRRDQIDKTQSSSSELFGVCTSVCCKYMFCPKCLCDYHPGEPCKISEPESPSKLLICHKKLKLKKNVSNSKLSSKRQSLRRLCFS